VGLLDAWASSPGGSLRPLLLEGDAPSFRGADAAPTRSPAQILVVDGHGTSAKFRGQVFRDGYGG